MPRAIALGHAAGWSVWHLLIDAAAQHFGQVCGCFRSSRAPGRLGCRTSLPGYACLHAGILHPGLVVRHALGPLPICSQKPDGPDPIKACVVHPVMCRAKIGKVASLVVPGVMVQVCDLQARRHLQAAHRTAFESLSLIRHPPRLGLVPCHRQEGVTDHDQPNSVSTYRTTSSPTTLGTCRWAGPAGMCSMSPGPASTVCASKR